MKLEPGAAKAEYAICLSSPMYFFYDDICSIVPCDWNVGKDESLPTLYLEQDSGTKMR